jgi:hypothetical protein
MSNTSHIKIYIKGFFMCVVLISLALNYGFIKGIITLPTQEIAQKDTSEGWDAIYAANDKITNKRKGK